MSDIVFSTINENFPVAGQDNDTQVFRDNFNSIKTALSTAKTEITDLQDNTARTDQTTDFLYNTVTSVTLKDAYLTKKDYGSTLVGSTQEVSFKEAMYHIIKFGANYDLTFIEFPTAAVGEEGFGKIGKATLEIYGDGTKRKITFAMSGVTVKKKSNFPALTEVGSHDVEVTSATNPVVVEVWQHNADVIFLNYVGQFS